MNPPRNHGYVNWPTPGVDTGDWRTQSGWHDDDQGGMVVYAVFNHPCDDAEPTPDAEPWCSAPRAEMDHYLDLGPGAPHDGLGPYLAVVPLGASSWSWWNYDGAGNSHPFEATYQDLTREGREIVAALETLYGTKAILVTHIDT